MKQSLIHPSRKGHLYGVRYSPDGKQFIAGDVPGGIVQVWDVATGRQLAKFETGYGHRGSWECFFLSPDWKTLYVPHETRRKATRFERGGKKMLLWECAGEVQAWDFQTGALRHTFVHTPPRGIYSMNLSPDGSTFVTFERLSGDSDRGPKISSSLWDVKTGRYRPLHEGLSSLAVFAPDGKTLAAPAKDEDYLTTAFTLFDVPTAREKVSIPLARKGFSNGFTAFSPDGRLFIGEVRDLKAGQNWLKFWDPATGREVASFGGDMKNYFLWMAFSPDGRTLAVTTNPTEGKQGKLFLFDVPGRQLAKTIILGEKAFVYMPVFSPDGKWIAVPTQVFPNDLRGREPEPEEAPQPRIHLIDRAAGVVREIWVAPQGFPASACFSPDGRTLATSGSGRVLLWDMTKMPALADQSRKP